MGADVIIYVVDRNSYERELVPAYRSFRDRCDTSPLAALLEREIARRWPGGSGSTDIEHSPAIYQEFVDILRGKQYYSSAGNAATEGATTSIQDMKIFVNELAAPTLLKSRCLADPIDLSPEQSMSRKDLAEYLYAHSKWIEDHFTFAAGPNDEVSEIRTGDWSRFLSDSEIHRLDAELSKIPIPEEIALQQEFNSLQRLIHRAAQDHELMVLMSIT